VKALVCPYCGATLHINLETVGRPYLTEERPVAAIRQTGDELGLFELDGEGA